MPAGRVTSGLNLLEGRLPSAAGHPTMGRPFAPFRRGKQRGFSLEYFAACHNKGSKAPIRVSLVPPLLKARRKPAPRTEALYQKKQPFVHPWPAPAKQGAKRPSAFLRFPVVKSLQQGHQQLSTKRQKTKVKQAPIVEFRTGCAAQDIGAKLHPPRSSLKPVYSAVAGLHPSSRRNPFPLRAVLSWVQGGTGSGSALNGAPL